MASEPSTGVFAVFDGHGGAYTSKYCEKHFLSMLEKSSKFATDKAAALKNTSVLFIFIHLFITIIIIVIITIAVSYTHLTLPTICSV